MSRIAEETSGIEAWLEVLACPTNGDLCRLLVSVLGLVEVPLRSIGEELEKNKGHENTSEDDVGSVHVLARDARCEHQDVGRSGDGEEQNALGKTNEEDVEDEEEWTIDPAADCLPSIILRANAVATSAPVVEGQTNRPTDTESQDIVESLRR